MAFFLKVIIVMGTVAVSMLLLALGVRLIHKWIYGQWKDN